MSAADKNDLARSLTKVDGLNTVNDFRVVRPINASISPPPFKDRLDAGAIQSAQTDNDQPGPSPLLRSPVPIEI